MSQEAENIEGGSNKGGFAHDSSSFVRLIESEKTAPPPASLHSEDDLDDFQEESDELRFLHSSPSPQPCPDVQEDLRNCYGDVTANNGFIQDDDDEGWEAVGGDACRVSGINSNTEEESHHNNHDEEELLIIKTSLREEDGMKTTTTSAAVAVGGQEMASTAMTTTTMEETSSSSTVTKTSSVKKKVVKKSKSEHISVVTAEGGPSVSRLKSVYSSNGDDSTRGKRVQSPTVSSSCEARVFAKVCVAHLRRSFGDLTDLTHNGVGEAVVAPVRGEVWRRSGSAQSAYNKSAWQKSSFTKFDALDKKKEAIVKKTESVASVGGGQEEKICRCCGKVVFLVELIKAEKAFWHKNCFRCADCNKQLPVDTYSSHEGKLYCKPHFKALFQPKAVFEDEVAPPVRPEVIIRESQPVELPPDVVRASDAPSTGLEDINVDVRSKFEMFEHFKERNKSPVGDAPAGPTKRSASVLAKLAARYEGKEDLAGIPNDELHGGEPVEGESDEDNADGNEFMRAEMRRKLQMNKSDATDLIPPKQMDEVRAKWEEGIKPDEKAEHRKAEMAKFRSRLCHGKSNHLKEQFEKGELENGGTQAPSNERLNELDALKMEKSKRFKEMFEKGEVVRGEEEEDGDQPQSLVEKDSAVFESGHAKQSRSLFKEMDQNLAKSQSVVLPALPTPRTPSEKVLSNKALFENAATEVVRSSDRLDDVLPVKVEDLSSKFKFFETYEKQLEEAKQKKKEFRITPPRDPAPSVLESNGDVYRDPNVVRSEDVLPPMEDSLVKSKTTSKMLNVFRQLEEQNQLKDSDNGPRPLKQFTPPREPARFLGNEDSEEEVEEEEEEEYEEGEEENNEGEGAINEKDAFLKEVGSLARARSLRARFERWEAEENLKNEEVSERSSVDGTGESIESARELKARFELLQAQQEEAQRLKKPQVNVRRFVAQELTNKKECVSLPPLVTVDMSSEQCAFCEKKVYAMEKVEANNKVYHKLCFRCSVCKSVLRMDSFTFHHGSLYCKNHFKQLFKIKGNYDEGFGHETQRQIWAKKQNEKENN